MECIDPNELNTHFIYVMNGIIIVVAWEIMYFHKNTKNDQ